MVYTALLSTVYYAVKTVVDPTIPPNAGLARPLTVTATEGTVLNCVIRPPSTAVWRPASASST
jgi:N-methylhydantoinase B